MHVAATNIILWIRTLVKETLEEIIEVEEERMKKAEHETDHHEAVKFNSGLIFDCCKQSLKRLYNHQSPHPFKILFWLFKYNVPSQIYFQ